VNPRSIIGTTTGVLAAIMLAFAPQAQAREAAKFKVLSLSGTSTSARDVVYGPSTYTSCSFSQSERLSFRSTKPITAYAFTSKAHGSGRVEWSTDPEFSGNLTQVEVPGEVTISRSATYLQTNYVDPETGEISYGCSDEVDYRDGSPATDCTIEKTFPVTLIFGGTSDSENSTYVYPSIEPGDMSQLDDACRVDFLGSADDPRLFPRADLFKKRKKRINDTDRVVVPAFDNPTDDRSETGSVVNELAGELKRKKQRR
jgi:hypothetical protein